MECAIYKSHRRAHTYLYVEEQGNFRCVRKTLLDFLGRLQFVMTLELTPHWRLAQADPVEMQRQLRELGYYWQLPPADFTTSAQSPRTRTVSAAGVVLCPRFW